MVKQRRVFSYLPDYFRTEQNDRQTAIADDVLYEPENASFIRGFIGDSSLLSQQDLERVPLISENDASADAYQLSIATTNIDPRTGEYQYGAFYTDLVNQIRSNGGFVDDPNRLFETGYYAWSPPIDYDKHVNFSSYYWTGLGNAEANGEYMTREITGSQVVFYQFNGTTFIKKNVVLMNGVSGVQAIGVLAEDSSDPNRPVYEFDGSQWLPIQYQTVDHIPTDTTGISTNQYFYVTRIGVDYQRPLVLVYSEQAGRWISQPVVVDLVEPEYPTIGMVWEDVRTAGRRRFRRFTGHNWIDLVFHAATFLSGIGTDQQYVYDISTLASGDDWSKQNWWRHREDLSQYDRSQLLPGDQAVRPILEFWNSLEKFPGDTKIARNQAPKFAAYYINPSLRIITPIGVGSTIMEYQKGTGRSDAVLGFIPSFNNLGEFQFDMTLDEMTTPIGYKYFKDSRTGLFHSTWSRALDSTSQSPISNAGDLANFYEVPKNLTSNPNHEVPSMVSRAEYLKHILANISGQDNFFGVVSGSNSYRWTMKNPIRGATIIDPEHSLLRIMATLQTPQLDVPEAIRFNTREYTRVIFRFLNRLNQLWDTLAFNDPTGRLTTTVTHATDSVLTAVFMSKTDQSEYSLSDMGTFMETRSFNGTATVVGLTPKPIYIPPSPTRLGVSQTFKPGKLIERDGSYKLRGHDGTLIPSFGDDRDLVWLDLQQRFFDCVPAARKTETETDSSRHNLNRIYVQDYFSGYEPNLAPPFQVDKIVENYVTMVSPTIGLYLSRTGPVYARWDGTNWGTNPVQVDDTVLNLDDNNYYIYNGLDIVKVPTWNVPGVDYTTNEFRRVIRRDFDRWTNDNGLDFSLNPEFDINDKFTWNYSSVGIEGHYKGLYRRVYHTDRPDSRPWEIVGYSIEPTWWRIHYTPSIVAVDGYPRYFNDHPMWNDLRTGLVHAPLGLINPQWEMLAPIPVDAQGELLDPISAGLIDEASLDQTRLDQGWTYGDGGPVEDLFYRSANYTFAVAMAGYLMKPSLWLDTFWVSGYFRVGRDTVWNGPHLVHEISMTRPKIGQIPLHRSLDTNGNPIAQHGVQEWISERLYKLGHDPVRDFATIVSNTSPVLAWKTAGFIDNKRTTVTTLGGSELPYEDLHPILHQSKPFREEFCSGIMVIRENTGFRVFGYDAANPNFRIEIPARSSFGGQVELREEVTLTKNQYRIELQELTLPRSVQASDTAKLAVLYKGLRLRTDFYSVVDSKTILLDGSLNIQGGEVLEVVTLTTISNPSTQMKSFAIGSVTYSYFSEGTGTFDDIPYGTFFPNANEVINFMLGYERFLVKRGWVFDSPEPSTNEVMDWLHGAKKFATWIQESTSVEALKNSVNSNDFDTFFYSPIRDQAKFVTVYGQVLNVESIQNGLYGVISKRGEPMATDSVFVNRIDGAITITPGATFSLSGENQLYGARVYLTEVQHVVMFSNRTKFNQTIYNPLFALYHKTLYVDTYRTNEWAGQLNAPGFIIRNGELLPNFEKQVYDFTRFYDRINPVNDPVKNEQAKNLVGYYPMDSYMDPILADQRSRFDYYRGMIKAKGTIRAIKAFARGTSMGPENIQIQEDWAWKLAEYGDLRRNLVQFKLDKASLNTQVQVIRFGVEVDDNSLFIEIPDLDRSEQTDTPWLIPPVPSENGISMMRFPLDRSGKVDYEQFKYRAKLFNTDTNLTDLDTFVWDPIHGRYEPEAYAQIDSISYYDPARYVVGSKASYSNDLFWGPQQVGHQWFTPETLHYFDYPEMIPDYAKVSKFWGKPLYYAGAITRTGNLATVTTYDAITGEEAEHGIQVGKDYLIKISGADQNEYNFSEIYATAINATQLTFPIKSAPTSPATGNIRIDVSWTWIWEWVESPVPPEQWVTYTAGLSGTDHAGGVPMYYGHPTRRPSYSRIDGTDANGNPITRYYFWVRNNPGRSPLLTKNFTSAVLEMRLRDPTSQGLAWIGIVDESTMLTYFADNTLLATSALEVVSDGRDSDTHVEWALITERSRIRIPPPRVWDKVKDSISGIDAQGNVVPYLGYTSTERYGTKFFPAQTIFVDRQKAFEVWRLTINRLFKIRDFSTDSILVGLFSLSDEYSSTNPTGYWRRTSHIDEAFLGKEPLETVATIQERDYRAINKFYMAGDLVEVVQSTHRDPWTGLTSSATYYYDGTVFVEVGSSCSTVEIMPTLFDIPEKFRVVYEDVRNLFMDEENSEMLISIIHEMLRQNPVCDWCFKTSYITAHVFDEFKQESYIHPNQIEAIFENIMDTKPYRTKFRSKTITFTISQAEDINVSVEDIFTDKVTLLFDRLSSSTFDDHGWDTHGWESWPWGWDRPLWELADYGRQEFVEIATLNGNSSTKTFVVTPPFDPDLYQVSVEFYIGSVLTDITTAGNGVTWKVDGKKLEFTFDIPPLTGHSLKVKMNIGFVQGQEPILGNGLDENFSVMRSTYEHLAARLIGNGRGLEAASLNGSDMNDRLGGRTEERIVPEITDGLLITVKMAYDPVMAGWGGAPFDTTPFDSPPADIGERVFFHTSGAVQVIPAGLSIFPTSEDIMVGSTPYVVGVNRHTIAQVKRSTGGPYTLLVEGTDYHRVSGFPHIIQLTAPNPGDMIRYVFNGWHVGPLGVFRVTSYPGSFDIVDDVLYLDTLVEATSISINYEVARYASTPMGLLARNTIIADDIMSDHLQYDGSLGFETNRPMNLIHINTTNSRKYRWDGSAWVDLGAISVGAKVFVKRTGEIWQNSNPWIRVYQPGDIYGLPVLNYPAFGKGVVSGTYTIGQLPDAATDFPAAYQIIQHTGDSIGP